MRVLPPSISLQCLNTTLSNRIVAVRIVKETYNDGVSHVIQILDNGHSAIRHLLRADSLLKL